MQRIETIRWYTRRQPERIVQLYEDELTSYRCPTLAQGYAPAGSRAPRADQGHQSTTAWRIAACLDVQTGQLYAWQRAHFDRQTLLRFYQEVERSYPLAEQIFLIHKNWSVHRHPALAAGLRGSKITLVLLPTYAPWLNPVEKVWRQLYAEVLTSPIPGSTLGNKSRQQCKPGWISGQRARLICFALSVCILIKL